MYNITFSVLINLNLDLIRIRNCVVTCVDLRFCFCALWGFLGILFFFIYVIQHCFICRPSDSTATEDARIEPRTVTTLALTARRSTTWLDLICGCVLHIWIHRKSQSYCYIAEYNLEKFKQYLTSIHENFSFMYLFLDCFSTDALLFSPLFYFLLFKV